MNLLIKVLKISVAVIAAMVTIIGIVDICKGVHHSLLEWIVFTVFAVSFACFAMKAWKHPSVAVRRQIYLARYKDWWQACGTKMQTWWATNKGRIGWLWREWIVQSLFALAFFLTGIATIAGIMALWFGLSLPWSVWAAFVGAAICFVALLKELWRALKEDQQAQAIWMRFKGWLITSWKPLVFVPLALCSVVILGLAIASLASLPKRLTGAQSATGMVSVQTGQDKITLPDKPVGIINTGIIGDHGTINYGTINNYGSNGMASRDTKPVRAERAPQSPPTASSDTEQTTPPASANGYEESADGRRIFYVCLRPGEKKTVPIQDAEFWHPVPYTQFSCDASLVDTWINGQKWNGQAKSQVPTIESFCFLNRSDHPINIRIVLNPA